MRSKTSVNFFAFITDWIYDYDYEEYHFSLISSCLAQAPPWISATTNLCRPIGATMDSRGILKSLLPFVNCFRLSTIVDLPPPSSQIVHLYQLIGSGSYPALLNHDPGVLVTVCASLCREHVLLTGIGTTCKDVTILENRCSVSKNEINGANKQAVDVELAVFVDVKGVLVAQHVTLVEC
ncbi:hypothetical protein L1987_67203 [Smallanthus sonchifolius]|uniref:Uncharacterized protein n=1 Tax=Smallanthus sonchifolius TaxID=185202 RepID=A0ACB9BZL6_9ASTR|nr:hypothetical protein L1987_67203 [Smallanthus sonchifolius]